MDMQMPVMDGCEATAKFQEAAPATMRESKLIYARTANPHRRKIWRTRLLPAGMNDFHQATNIQTYIAKWPKRFILVSKNRARKPDGEGKWKQFFQNFLRVYYPAFYLRSGCQRRTKKQCAWSSRPNTGNVKYHKRSVHS